MIHIRDYWISAYYTTGQKTRSLDVSNSKFLFMFLYLHSFSAGYSVSHSCPGMFWAMHLCIMLLSEVSPCKVQVFLEVIPTHNMNKCSLTEEVLWIKRAFPTGHNLNASPIQYFAPGNFKTIETSSLLPKWLRPPAINDSWLRRKNFVL